MVQLSPSGAVHVSIWKKYLPFAVVLSAILIMLTRMGEYGLLFMLGYSVGRYIDPDLDLIGITSAEGRLMRELKVFGMFVTMWFLPYAYLLRFIGGHRSFFSHFPVIGTVGRMIWLFSPLLFVYWWWVADIPLFVWYYLVVFGAGLGLADLFHYIADVRGGEI